MKSCRLLQWNDFSDILHIHLQIYCLVFFQFDIIISEWMGYFLLFESMLDTVLYARDRFLKPSGVVLPDHCALYIAGLSDPSLHQRNVQYWDDVYGFKMSCMKNVVLKEASVTIVKDSSVHTDYALLKVILSQFSVHFSRHNYVAAQSAVMDFLAHRFCACTDNKKTHVPLPLLPTQITLT